MTAFDRLLFETPNVRVGAFRCPRDHPCFSDTGPIETHIVVFTRSAVWIRHAGATPFVADASVVTVYNKGQEYTRAPVARDGDRSDWFGVSPEVACSIAQEFDPHIADDPLRPFRFASVPSDTVLYLRQRSLFRRLERSVLAPLDAEEKILALVGEVIRRAYGAPRAAASRLATDRHRDLVERARAELARDPAAQTDLSTLARRLEVSPYHLCRVFRALTGVTLHGLRLELRLRIALERLADPKMGLSRLALDLGFSSHSHFTSRFRTHLGAPPSTIRRHLIM